jgi:hypothetical protein
MFVSPFYQEVFNLWLCKIPASFISHPYPTMNKSPFSRFSSQRSVSMASASASSALVRVAAAPSWNKKQVFCSFSSVMASVIHVSFADLGFILCIHPWGF